MRTGEVTGTPAARDGFRRGVNEISGALGDLATFLPLAIGLIAVNGVNPTSLFLCAGLLYIGAGLYYRVPIPVQPLKATSAIAIAVAAKPDAIAATAILMGLIFAGASLFNLGGLFRRLFSRPVVRGIQLGLAVLLVQGGLRSVVLPGTASAGGIGEHPAFFGVAVGTVVGGIILLSRDNRRYPAALAVLLFGILCGLAVTSADALGSLSVGWVSPSWGIPAGADLRTAILLLLLPQIPLTFANSVVATADASRAYYGERAGRVTCRGLAASLGIANILAGLAGGMPMCHGSGGVTAHYRFGARTGGANLFIGGLFVAVALLFGKSASVVSGLLPPAVLGIMLIHVGIEHARLLRDIADLPGELAVAVVIGVTTLATGNLAIAFAVGIAILAIGRRLRRKSAFRGVRA